MAQSVKRQKYAAKWSSISYTIVILAVAREEFTRYLIEKNTDIMPLVSKKIWMALLSKISVSHLYLSRGCIIIHLSHITTQQYYPKICYCRSTQLLSFEYMSLMTILILLTNIPTLLFHFHAALQGEEHVANTFFPCDLLIETSSLFTLPCCRSANQQSD